MRALILASILFLSGCGYVVVPHWDNTEYNDLVSVAALSSKGDCSVEQRDKLSEITTHALYYSKFLPANDLTHEGIAQMNKTVQELNDAPKVSQAFCDIRLRAIHLMSTSMAKAVGGKPR